MRVELQSQLLLARLLSSHHVFIVSVLVWEPLSLGRLLPEASRLVELLSLFQGLPLVLDHPLSVLECLSLNIRCLHCPASALWKEAWAQTIRGGREKRFVQLPSFEFAIRKTGIWNADQVRAAKWADLWNWEKFIFWSAFGGGQSYVMFLFIRKSYNFCCIDSIFISINKNYILMSLNLI